MAAEKTELSARLVVLEKNTLVDAVLLALVPLGVVAFLGYLFSHYAALALGLHVAVAAAVFRFGFARQNTLPRLRERAVRVSADGLVVDGKVIPRSLIAAGWSQPRPTPEGSGKRREPRSSVQLFDRAKRLVFEAEVESEAQAVSVLRTLGLDASQRRAEIAGASPLVTSVWRSLALLASGFVLAGLVQKPLEALGVAQPLPLSLLVLVLVTLMGAVPSKIVVGVDGVLVRWLGWRRFFPMSEIVSAKEHDWNAVRLELTGGRVQLLYTGGQKRHSSEYYRQRCAVLLARIREAQAAHRARGPAPDVATLVGRAGRTNAEWREALSALAQRETGYRRAAIREEDLWRVVEDPRAPEDARAGAALLLRRDLDDEGKARVRVAAEATASPKLRVALEAASAGSDEAALDAIDEIAVSPPRRAVASGGR